MTSADSKQMGRFDDDELVPIAALEHFSYCPRQCALMYVEATFVDNVLTLRGTHVHERVHEERPAIADGVRVERGLPVVSRHYGLTGKADSVEFHDGVPYPVEYKRGKTTRFIHAELQVAAQAVCLEEMLSVPVTEGAIFCAASQRRRRVAIDEKLRRRVGEAADAVRSLMTSAAMPPPAADKRCPNCSLVNVCLPFVVSNNRRLKAMRRALFRPDPPGQDQSIGG